MTPIYKITSKKATNLLTKEFTKKSRYINKIVKSIKSKFPDVEYVKFLAHPGTVKVAGVEFKQDADIDRKLWKKAKFKYEEIYIPKCSSKESKELYKEFWEIASSKNFFDKEEILNLLDYHPKSELEFDETNMMCRRVTFEPGFGRDSKGNRVYFFKAYSNYKPPRGVKEVTISEYQRHY